MNMIEITIMKIRKHFRKHNKTNWDKNQIIEELDNLEEEFKK